MTIYRLLCTVLLAGVQFISTNVPHNLGYLSFTITRSTVALPHRNRAPARTSSASCGAWHSYKNAIYLELPFLSYHTIRINRQYNLSNSLNVNGIT